MNAFAKLVLFCCLAGAATGGAAQEPPQGASRSEPSLQSAMGRFAQDHQEMRDLLSREIIHADLADVHNLTYSLQGSLAQIETQIQALQRALEEVQLATERGEQITAKQEGLEFLDQAQPLIN